MLKVVLNQSIEDCKEWSLSNAKAEVIGIKLVVTDNNRCVLVTDLLNVKSLSYWEK